MPISFDRIPTTIRTPGFLAEFSSERAIQGVQLKPYKVLLIGQKLAAGSVAELVPTRITSPSQASAYFGTASQLHGMAEAYFANNAFTETWAVAIDDPGGGVQATGTLTFGGPATASGSIYLLIAGRRLVVNVASGDTAAEVAAAVAAAIQARIDLPVTAAAVAEVVTCTARNAGTLGNGIDLRVNYYQGETLPAGITLAIVAMSTGAGVVDLGEVWPVLGDEQFDVIAPAGLTDTANLDSLDQELEDRWDPPRMIEGVALTATAASHASAITLGDGRNSRHVSIMSSFGSPSPVWEWSAALAGLVAYYGNIDPARPFQTLEVEWVKPEALADRFTLAERDLLLHDGIATHVVAAGDRVRVERLVTTYQENEFGAEDPSYLDLCTPLTLGFLRWSVRNRFLLRFPRHKLGSDDARFGPGQSVVTPQIARAELIAWARELEELGLIENLDAFKRDIVVERNASDPNRLDMLLPPDLVNQARLFAAKIEFRV